MIFRIWRIWTWVLQKKALNSNMRLKAWRRRIKRWRKVWIVPIKFIQRGSSERADKKMDDSWDKGRVIETRYTVLSRAKRTSWTGLIGISASRKTKRIRRRIMKEDRSKRDPRARKSGEILTQNLQRWSQLWTKSWCRKRQNNKEKRQFSLNLTTEDEYHDNYMNYYIKFYTQ